MSIRYEHRFGTDYDSLDGWIIKDATRGGGAGTVAEGANYVSLDSGGGAVQTSGIRTPILTEFGSFGPGWSIEFQFRIFPANQASSPPFGPIIASPFESYFGVSRLSDFDRAASGEGAWCRVQRGGGSPDYLFFNHSAPGIAGANTANFSLYAPISSNHPQGNDLHRGRLTRGSDADAAQVSSFHTGKVFLGGSAWQDNVDIKHSFTTGFPSNWWDAGVSLQAIPGVTTAGDQLRIEKVSIYDEELTAINVAARSAGRAKGLQRGLR